jgi:mono/diheme cytochrome c family protein/plastocyanin
MTDQPGQGPERQLPVPRPETAPVVAPPPVPGPARRVHELTPERAAAIVRQSGSARWVGFLAVVVIVVFVSGYWFYEQGVPGVPDSSRLGAEVTAQQVADVTEGYALFEANCARCHGATGGGGIGPVLNDQAKLLTHLTAAYIQNVLTVGGRYVCGDPNSVMPVWSDQGNPPGALNYRQIQEIIAFLRAPNTLSFQGVDPATGQTTTMTGWRDPGYQPPAGATPVPACWKDAFKSAAPASAAPSGSPAASGAPASAAPSAAASGGGAATTIQLLASGIQFDKSALTAPANTPFQIDFTNNDASIMHNVAITSSSGQQVFVGDFLTGVASTTYNVPALPAGTYTFVCQVHPNMTGTLTVQ